MNIQYFVSVRKRLGFSQSELSEGICTQTTLSRFENNNQIPSIKLLIKLCDRLNISIGDLFPTTEIKQDELSTKLEKAEFYLITSEYQKLENTLAEIPTIQPSDLNLELLYNYLLGFNMIFKNMPITDILFIFDDLILKEKRSKNRIFKLLALTGKGIVYARDMHNEKADYYFEQVFTEIYDYPIESIVDVWRILNIVVHSGEYYGNHHEINTSNSLLEYAITICSENHVTYYLARAAYQLALNAIKEKKPKRTITELLSDAKAYAKINNNIKLINKIDNLKQE